MRTDQIQPVVANRMSSLANAVKHNSQNEKIMYIKNVSTDQVIEVIATRDPQTGKVTY